MTRTTTKKEGTKMGMSEAPFSMTFKMLDGNGMSHLITMRGEAATADDIMEIFQARDEVVERLTENDWKPAPEFGGNKYGGKSNNRSYSKSKSEDDNNDDSDGDSKSCRHGSRVKKSGNSKKGPWTGYFCKARKCDPVWDNGDDETADF